MTNEEFVKKKLNQKFDYFWEKAIRKLPYRNENIFSKTYGFYRYYFNKTNSKIDNEPCISCKRAIIKDGVERNLTDRKVYSKKELKEIYVEYDRYNRELQYIFSAGKEFSPDPYAGNFSCDKKTKELYLLQRMYAFVFLSSIGLNVIEEQKCLRLNFNEIKDYICDRQLRFCDRYFEFRKYRFKRIHLLLDSHIDNILLNAKYEKFIEFCKRKDIIDLKSLFFVPYYSIGFVKVFGPSLIESVLFDIKRYIEIHMLFDKYVSLEDIEG